MNRRDFCSALAKSLLAITLVRRLPSFLRIGSDWEVVDTPGEVETVASCSYSAVYIVTDKELCVKAWDELDDANIPWVSVPLVEISPEGGMDIDDVRGWIED